MTAFALPGGGFSFLALTTLALSGCDALAELPEYLPSLPLTRLCVERCPKLQALPAGYSIAGASRLLRMEVGESGGLIGELEGRLEMRAPRWHVAEMLCAVGSGRPASARAAAFESMLTHRLTDREEPVMIGKLFAASTANPDLAFVLTPHGGDSIGFPGAESRGCSETPSVEWHWTAAAGLHSVDKPY